MALRPRDLNSEANGLVQTPQGPAFNINVGVQIPLRRMLKQLSKEQISLLIREAEAELGNRDE